MGNNISTVSRDTSLKAKLHELGDVICNLGNPCIGNAVKTVCDSPDRGASLFKVVAAEINRQKNHRQSTEREKFFQQFRWKGQSLSEVQVTSLAAATKNWELNDNDLEELKKSANTWASTPEKFFDSETTNLSGRLELIAFCFNDTEQIEEVNPTRRKINLIIMSEQIRQEVEYQCSKHKINHRATTDPQKPLTLMSKVLSSITDTFGPLSQNERKKKHRKLKKQSRGGSSWARIEPRWMVLALKNAAVKSFEEKRWGLMEIEALNAYVRVLRAYAEKDLLSTAYSKILEEYHQRAPLRQDRSEAFTLNESRKRSKLVTAHKMRQGHEPNPANANGQHTQPTTSGIFQSDNMPVLGNPSSEQQGVQSEREQELSGTVAERQRYKWYSWYSFPVSRDYQAGFRGKRLGQHIPLWRPETSSDFRWWKLSKSSNRQLSCPHSMSMRQENTTVTNEVTPKSHSL
ncbi:hypothetical protein ACJ73_03783 [Blastomyces percursus]|uniref:Uncharacterized protein n=1 Tax=Blastomyces percursus TaxID=1658174 RepID=A0A1J9Q8Q2_9EURO|nr:hypothetical protein ACJ73_03783 [Blastomyces percursus]